MLCCAQSLSHVRLFATPWTAAFQASPSMGFSRQEYWSGLPSPFPRICITGNCIYKASFQGEDCWKLKDRKRGELSIFSLPSSGISSKCCIFTVIPGPLENPSFSWSQLPQTALEWVQFQLDGPSLEIPLSTGVHLQDVPHLLCISEAPLQTVPMSKPLYFSIRTLIMTSIFPNVYNSKIYIYHENCLCPYWGHFELLRRVQFRRYLENTQTTKHIRIGQTL